MFYYTFHNHLRHTPLRGIKMAGVAGRSGRHSKPLEQWFDDATNLTMKYAALLIKDESFPLIDRVRVCLPLAMKRIPERIESVNIMLNAEINPEIAKGLLDLADRNILLHNELRKEIAQATDNTSYVKPATLETNADTNTSA